MDEYRNWSNKSREDKDDTYLDERIAAFTDALIAGEADKAAWDDPEMREMQEVVTKLHDLIEPRNSADTSFKRHLAHRLEMEWNLTHRHNQHRRTHRLHILRPLKWAAGLGIVLLASLLFLLILEGDKIPFLQGSAVPPSSEGVAVALAAAAIALLAAAVYAIWRRRK